MFSNGHATLCNMKGTVAADWAGEIGARERLPFSSKIWDL